MQKLQAIAAFIVKLNPKPLLDAIDTLTATMQAMQRAAQALGGG